MKLIIYVRGDALKHFPSSEEMDRQCVGVSAVRTGPDVVRWTLTGPPAMLDEYAAIARAHGLKYSTGLNHGPT